MYGVPPERLKEFNDALVTIRDIYKEQFYASDNLICLQRNRSYRLDRKFITSFLDSATTPQEKSLAWRLHTLTWAAKNALRVEGDFVECGVLEGYCSSVLFKYLDFQNLPRYAYLYDTFSGLPEETSTEEERRMWNYTRYDSEELYESVRQKFASYPNVKVIQGIVPDSFEEAVPEKIAFLHIDMNSEKAEMLALDYLFDRVSRGGMIVFDDFGWSCNVDQTLSEWKFMNERDHAVLELPTGQGLVIKN